MVVLWCMCPTWCAHSFSSSLPLCLFLFYLSAIITSRSLLYIYLKKKKPSSYPVTLTKKNLSGKWPVKHSCKTNFFVPEYITDRRFFFKYIYYDSFVCNIQVSSGIIFISLCDIKLKDDSSCPRLSCVKNWIIKVEKELNSTAANSGQSNIDKVCFCVRGGVLKGQLPTQSTTSSSPLHSLSTPVFSPCEPVSPLVMD